MAPSLNRQEVRRLKESSTGDTFCTIEMQNSAPRSRVLEAVGIKAVTLPPRSPNLNAHLERWNRSVKAEWLSKMILFGEASLRQVLSNYVAHFHTERNHQGKDNVILFPVPADRIG